MSAPRPESLVAAGYALFLIAVAAGLDLLARHTHARAERYRTGGFRFHRHLDAWECPEGELLPRLALDHERRVVRYRARAHVCNGCPAKPDCTDSDKGRELVRPIDPWPHSDVGRFHRGISLALTALAALIVCVEAARHHAPLELAALLVPALAVLAFGPRLVRTFLSTPSGFPEAAPKPPPPEERDPFAAGWSARER